MFDLAGNSRAIQVRFNEFLLYIYLKTSAADSDWLKTFGYYFTTILLFTLQMYKTSQIVFESVSMVIVKIHYKTISHFSSHATVG